MKILCPACRRPMTIPEDKYKVAGLRGRCSGCQAVFVVSEAPLAPQVPQAPQVPLAPPAPAPPTPSPAPPVPPAPAARPRPSSPPHWRRCVNHPQLESASVCPACKKGYCQDCCKTVGSAVICPECDGLCRARADHEAAEARARQRARSMRDELPIIARYPLIDVVAFVLLAGIVAAFRLAGSIAAFGGGYAALFSQGLLMAYSFTAVNRVSNGDLKNFMPNISDITDLAVPLRLGLAALLVSSAPLLLLVFLYPDSLPRMVREARGAIALPVARAQDAEAPAPQAEAEGEQAGSESDTAAESASTAPGAPAPDYEPLEASGPSAWIMIALGFALLWKLVYAPIALMVAAISRGFFKTLNPIVGIVSIRSMGAVYWEAMGIYTAIVLAQGILGLGFGLIPFAGAVLKAFVDAYAYLAIGCTLGLAVFKKARELGLE